MTVNNTQEELDEINAIVHEYVDKSELLRPREEGKMIYKWAETVHACRKSHGIPTPRKYNKLGIAISSTQDKRAIDYSYENNTESEKDVPTWDISPSDLDGFFDSARFDRYLTWSEDTSFERRISWLFPDSGCWVRAELYSDLIMKFVHEKYPDKKFNNAKKHFAFGTLRAQSDNIPQGTVSWGYHVAPMIRLNDDKLYILDPALSPDAIEKEGWYKLMMTKPEARITGFVTCEPNAYDAFSRCFNPVKYPNVNVLCEIQGFLQLEWFRQQELGRDPSEALGDDTKFYLQG